VRVDTLHRKQRSANMQDATVVALSAHECL
jgi:hypothetical protein